MILRPLELSDLEQVRQWRLDITETLRTSYFLTRKMQEEYYEEVISNRYGNTRYWGLWYSQYNTMDGALFIGMGGIENIEWENRRGEISVLVNPAYRGQGHGKKCVDTILDQAFSFLNLNTVWGECFECANYKFWEKIVEERQAYSTWLPARKYWNGQYWKSLYFTFKKETTC